MVLTTFIHNFKKQVFENVKLNFVLVVPMLEFLMALYYMEHIDDLYQFHFRYVSPSTYT